ncbi:hypothetical protein BKA70DRAFT_177399 [Coprinopsis sp. MPI-PUGE-AT-0042]|nr:hypothetical protein BKA70DRAFT_177399 [Coprinopsis sp. MPI-PUGE-AT-0042]
MATSISKRPLIRGRQYLNLLLLLHRTPWLLARPILAVDHNSPCRTSTLVNLSASEPPTDGPRTTDIERGAASGEKTALWG